MSNLIVLLVFIITIPTMLFIIEFLLCKKHSKFAVVLPVIVACFAVLFGFLAIMVSAIMFLIYFVFTFSEKEKIKKLSEIDKMNIEDL